MQTERVAEALVVRNSTDEEDKDLSEAPSTIADQLVVEHRNGVKFHKLDGISDLPDAYRVQDAYVAATIGNDACAGYKIGLTSKRMQ
jgi:2-keto-4-pentenoate hydratase